MNLACVRVANNEDFGAQRNGIAVEALHETTDHATLRKPFSIYGLSGKHGMPIVLV
jgi:hypothetical protein